MEFPTMVMVASGALWRDATYSSEDFRRLQRRKLCEIVAHAKRNVPLYTSLYKNVNPDDFRIEDLPVVTKPLLMDNFERTLAGDSIPLQKVREFMSTSGGEGLLDGKYKLTVTSGTTGRVGYFLHDREAWALIRGALLSRVFRHRLRPHEVARFMFGRRYRMAWIMAVGGNYITYLMSRDPPAAGRLLTNVRTYSVMRPIERNVETLNKFRPHFVHSYPTYLEALAYEKIEGRLKIDPEFVSVGSEPFTKAAREVIRKAFPGATITEIYGTTECIPMANQCKAGRLHVNEDFSVVEAVDEKHKPVPVGVPSHCVLVTNLLNKCQPIIRYEVTDSIKFTGEKCECGINLPVVEVFGRADDIIFLKNQKGEVRAYSPIPFEVLFLQVDGLKQYQLIHEEQNVLRIKCVPAEGADADAVARKVEMNLLRYFEGSGLGGAIRVRTECVAEIPREPRCQKIRQIVSHVLPPTGEQRFTEEVRAI